MKHMEDMTEAELYFPDNYELTISVDIIRQST